MSEANIEQVHGAVKELREELKGARVDHEKVERINTFLDSAEEKIFQPLTQARELAKTHEVEKKELIEKLESSQASATEIKARMEALEIVLARSNGPASDPDYKASDEYKALQEFAIRGESRLSAEQKQLLRTDSATEGGVLVPTELDNVITKKITEIDPIRSIARVRTIGGKSIELPIRSSIPAATYEGETEAGADSVATYEASTVTPFRQTHTSPITLDMLQDSAFDMESEIAMDSAEGFAFGEGNGYVLGTGLKQPQGFANHPTITTNDITAGGNGGGFRTSGIAADISANSMILLTGDLKAGYDPVYVFNRRTLARIRTFRADAVSAADEAGSFLWEPNMNGGVAPTIGGFPYILANSMPDIAANAFPVAFGDFRRAYTIVDRIGLTVVRDEFTLKKSGIVEFTMNRWNTGQVTLQEPIVLLKCST